MYVSRFRSSIELELVLELVLELLELGRGTQQWTVSPGDGQSEGFTLGSGWGRIGV